MKGQFTCNATDGDARIGELRTKTGVLNTPCLFTYTRRGYPLSISLDIVDSLKPLLQGVQMDTMQFLENPDPPTLHAYGKGAHKLYDLEGLSILASNRDPLMYEYSSRSSSNTHVHVSIHSGGQLVTPQLYMDAIFALKPDLFVALADEVRAPEAGEKRVRTSLQRNSEWLRACLAFLKAGSVHFPDGVSKPLKDDSATDAIASGAIDGAATDGAADRAQQLASYYSQKRRRAEQYGAAAREGGRKPGDAGVNGEAAMEGAEASVAAPFGRPRKMGKSERKRLAKAQAAAAALEAVHRAEAANLDPAEGAVESEVVMEERPAAVGGGGDAEKGKKEDGLKEEGDVDQEDDGEQQGGATKGLKTPASEAVKETEAENSKGGLEEERNEEEGNQKGTPAGGAASSEGRPMVLVPVGGGRFPHLRRQAARSAVEALAAADVLGGFAISGLGTGEDPALRRELIHTAVAELTAAAAAAANDTTSSPNSANADSSSSSSSPPTASVSDSEGTASETSDAVQKGPLIDDAVRSRGLVFVPGLLTPLEQLEAVAGGVDLFDCAIVAQATAAGSALVFPIRKGDVAGQKNLKRLGEESAEASANSDVKDGSSGVDNENADKNVNNNNNNNSIIIKEEEDGEGEGEGASASDGYRLSLMSTENRRDRRPFLEGCSCFACQRHTRAYVHHLLQAHEMLAEILLEVHNTHHMLSFFEAAREAISEGRFSEHLEWFRGVVAAAATGGKNA